MPEQIDIDQDLTAAFAASAEFVKQLRLAASRQLQTGLEAGVLLAKFASRVNDLAAEYQDEFRKAGWQWDDPADKE